MAGEVRADLQARLTRRVDTADRGGELPLTAAALAQTDPVERLEQLVAALRQERVIVAAAVRAAGDRSAQSHEPCHELESVDCGGEPALAVFTALHHLSRTLPNARPVPVSAKEAARLALTQYGGKIVVNPVGTGNGEAEASSAIRLPRPATVALADEDAWVPAWRDAGLTQHLRGLVKAPLAFIRCLPTANPVQPVRVGVLPGASRRQVVEALALLAGDARLLAACEGIELQPTPVEMA